MDPLSLDQLSSSDRAGVSVMDSSGATNLRKERWCQALHGSTQEGASGKVKKVKNN